MANRVAKSELDPMIAVPAGLNTEQAAVVAPQRSAVAPFVVGTLVGGVAGTILGTALSPYTRGLVLGLYHLITRRLSSSERDQLRFELLLQ